MSSSTTRNARKSCCGYPRTVVLKHVNGVVGPRLEGIAASPPPERRGLPQKCGGEGIWGGSIEATSRSKEERRPRIQRNLSCLTIESRLSNTMSARLLGRSATRSCRQPKRFIPYIASRPISQKTYTLNTGAKLPAIGFGTFQDKEQQESAVYNAINAGFRHIDTARV